MQGSPARCVPRGRGRARSSGCTQVAHEEPKNCLPLQLRGRPSGQERLRQPLLLPPPAPHCLLPPPASGCQLPSACSPPPAPSCLLLAASSPLPAPHRLLPSACPAPVAKRDEQIRRITNPFRGKEALGTPGWEQEADSAPGDAVEVALGENKAKTVNAVSLCIYLAFVFSKYSFILSLKTPKWPRSRPPALPG